MQVRVVKCIAGLDLAICWYFSLSPWWRHQMETFSALLAICAGNSPVSGEFPVQRPVTRSFDIFFDLRLNKRLSKQSWGWWFETLLCPLWRHCNDTHHKRLRKRVIWPFVIRCNFLSNKSLLTGHDMFFVYRIRQAITFVVSSHFQFTTVSFVASGGWGVSHGWWVPAISVHVLLCWHGLVHYKPHAVRNECIISYETTWYGWMTRRGGTWP